jgi:hypothetical protein
LNYLELNELCNNLKNDDSNCEDEEEKSNIKTNKNDDVKITTDTLNIPK